MIAGTAAALFIGDLAFDEYYRASAWPELGSKAVIDPTGERVGGMIANAAVTFAGLGGSARLVATLNDSARSRALLARVADMGVDTSLSRVDVTLGDSRTMIVMVGDDSAVLLPATREYTVEIDDALLAAMSAVPFVYTSVYELRRLRRDGDIGGFLARREFRLLVDVDVEGLQQADMSLLASADVVFTNRAGLAASTIADGKTSVADAALELGITTLAVTEGSLGCSVHTRAGTARVPAFHSTVVDPTGAGDAFGAGFTYALSRTDDTTVAATFANAVAALAVASPGGQNNAVTLEKVKAVLDAAGADVKPIW